MITTFNNYILESEKFIDYRSIDHLETLTPDELGKLLIYEVDSRSPSMEYIQNILDVGCPIDVRDTDGWTALHYAAKYGHLGVMKILLSRGADVNARDRWRSRTPLHWAVRSGYPRVVEFLLSKGVDINDEDDHGQTAWDLSKDKMRKQVPELNPNK